MEPSQASPDKSVGKLKQQLAQLDKLIAEGVLTGEAARKARDDLERQILAAVLGEQPAAAAAPAPAGAPPPVQRAPRKLLAGAAVFVLAFGLIGYAARGNHEGWNVGPGEPGAAPAAEGAAHSTQAAQIEAMIARLAERLKAAPNDAEGWSMLARSYTAQGRYAEALPAYKRVVELKPQDAQALADYADGLATANNRTLDGEPEKFILQALKLDPANVKALALAGTVAFNRNDFKGAAGHWERAVQASDPASEFTKQLQGALNEARQRAGLPPVAAASAPSIFATATEPPAAAPAGTAPAAAGNATVTGRVSLAAAVQGKVGPDDTVFIFARAPTGSRMPLAILRKKVSDLPFEFKLDDSLAMSPAAKLSTTPQVVVGARISKSGNAIPQPGDWQALSAPVAVGTQGLRLEIADAVP